MKIIGLYNHQELLKAGLYTSHPDIFKTGLLLIDNTTCQFKSFGQAIRSVLDHVAEQTVLVIAHQDVIFYDPESFGRLWEWTEIIAKDGCFLAGVVGQTSHKTQKEGQGVNPIISGGKQLHNKPITKPKAVNVIDECVIMTNRKTIETFDLFTDFRFDWHLYAADAALTLAKHGYPVYVLPLKVNHLSAGHVDIDYLNKAGLLLKKYGLRKIYTTNGLISKRIIMLRRFERLCKKSANPLKHMIKFS